MNCVKKKSTVNSVLNPIQKNRINSIHKYCEFLFRMFIQIKIIRTYEPKRKTMSWKFYSFGRINAA